RAVLEVAPLPFGHGVLTGRRVAERPGLPAARLVLVTDAPEHLVRAGGRRPVDRPLLEHAVAADPIRSRHLFGDREPEERATAAERAVLRVDRTDDRAPPARTGRARAPVAGAAGLREDGGEPVGVRLDARRPAAPARLAAVVVAEHGLDPLIAPHAVVRIEAREPRARLVGRLRVRRVGG